MNIPLHGSCQCGTILYTLDDEPLQVVVDYRRAPGWTPG